MSILLIVIHVVVCIALIMIVLLQTGKGADMGAAFGGGSSQTLFGSTGASTFLSKATTAAAIIFMLTSLILAYMSGGTAVKSVVPNTQAPIEQSAQPESDAAATQSGTEGNGEKTE
jgi:preprotein translocase subunit SecG